MTHDLIEIKISKALPFALFISIFLHVVIFNSYKIYKNSEPIKTDNVQLLQKNAKIMVSFKEPKNTESKTKQIDKDTKVNKVESKQVETQINESTKPIINSQKFNNTYKDSQKSERNFSYEKAMLDASTPQSKTFNNYNNNETEVGHTAISETTKDYRFSQYFDDWKNKVERIGTMNYPKEVDHATLILKVILKPDGEIEDIKIMKSSGNNIADEAAISTVKLGSPYAKFPSNMAKETKYLDITKTWSFNKNKVNTW